MQKKTILGISLIVIAAFTLGAALPNKWIFPQIYRTELIRTVNIGPPNSNIVNLEIIGDSYVYQYRDGVLIYYYEHPGVVTNFGRNYTAAKFTGSILAWSLSGTPLNFANDYMGNLTYVAMGLDNSPHLSASATVLPSEATRVTVPAANFTVISLAKFNMTAYWRPGGSGNMNASMIMWRSSGNYGFIYDIYSTFAYTASDLIIVKWQIYVNTS